MHLIMAVAVKLNVLAIPCANAPSPKCQLEQTSCSYLNISKWSQLRSSRISPPSFRSKLLRGARVPASRRASVCKAMYVDEEDGYLIDAPVSQGDGFSFTGGKYSDEAGPAEAWEARGRYVSAYPVEGGLQKAVDPVFNLPMGHASQTSGDKYKWFYVEEGPAPAASGAGEGAGEGRGVVLLLHGLASQSYSFRTVLPALSLAGFRAIAPDWLGFGLSEKPQPKYGFDYTVTEYAAGLKYFVEALGLSKVTLVAQDPIRASDKVVGEAGAYAIDEEDAMVYRRPYLTSGMSGFALTAVVRALQKELKGSLAQVRAALASPQWTRPTGVIWGRKDRWLDFNGVPEFAKLANAKVIELAEVGHHAQEDYGEEVGKAVLRLLR
eukprot:jgi/Mesen1/3686/ME000202S02771